MGGGYPNCFLGDSRKEFNMTIIFTETDILKMTAEAIVFGYITCPICYATMNPGDKRCEECNTINPLVRAE